MRKAANQAFVEKLVAQTVSLLPSESCPSESKRKHNCIRLCAKCSSAHPAQRPWQERSPPPKAPPAQPRGAQGCTVECGNPRRGLTTYLGPSQESHRPSTGRETPTLSPGEQLSQHLSDSGRWGVAAWRWDA